MKNGKLKVKVRLHHFVFMFSLQKVTNLVPKDTTKEKDITIKVTGTSNSRPIQLSQSKDSRSVNTVWKYYKKTV